MRPEAVTSLVGLCPVFFAVAASLSSFARDEAWTAADGSGVSAELNRPSDIGRDGFRGPQAIGIWRVCDSLPGGLHAPGDSRVLVRATSRGKCRYMSDS